MSVLNRRHSDEQRWLALSPLSLSLAALFRLFQTVVPGARLTTSYSDDGYIISTGSKVAI